LERVLAELPPAVHKLLEDVPLLVEDYPSRKVMRDQGITDPSELCGLFDGRSLIERSVEDTVQHPDTVTIYRLGILEHARDEDGRISAACLREEIRITILHELAHYHGFDEKQIEELGYG
jgi:predicted Zn-dependent protease with MMP-like domain